MSDTSSPSNAIPAPDAESKPDWFFKPAKVSAFQADLIQWFHTHGRDLPWRHTKDAYAILVSEFMLQQTQVATVIAYYERWMSRFPDVQTLAAASEHDVLALWQGLGYYSRARNLHRAAKAVVEMHDGRIPDSLPALRALPGIGEYTAAAVAAFSWDHPVPVVDANIARVLARLTDWQDRIDTGSGREFLRETATSLQPKSSGGRLYNSAIMELGALVCRAGQPNCLLCPVQNYCTTSIPAALPLKSPRATTEFRNERVAFILEENHIYLKQSESARWRGLWHMPEIPKTLAAPEHSLNYPITKYKVRLDVVRGHRAETQDLKGFRIDEIDSIPMPAPHRRAIMAMLKNVLRAIPDVCNEPLK